jgi:hypothetical protein
VERRKCIIPARRYLHRDLGIHHRLPRILMFFRFAQQYGRRRPRRREKQRKVIRFLGHLANPWTASLLLFSAFLPAVFTASPVVPQHRPEEDESHRTHGFAINASRSHRESSRLCPRRRPPRTHLPNMKLNLKYQLCVRSHPFLVVCSAERHWPSCRRRCLFHRPDSG